jgi:hypothetical protein
MKSHLRYTTIKRMLTLVILLLWVVGGWGWVWNIMKIVDSDIGAPIGMLVMRIIGVFVAPLGAVLGFL